MKTMINLPEPLMTEVKSLADREQRKLDELVAELVRAGIESRTHLVEPPAQLQASAEQWVKDWIKLGEEMLRDAPPGPSATEILATDRNRLERTE